MSRRYQAHAGRPSVSPRLYVGLAVAVLIEAAVLVLCLIAFPALVYVLAGGR